MKDYLDLGPTPYEEDCVQVGADNYHALAKAECERFALGMWKYFGDIHGCTFAVKNNPHDFGYYLSVIIKFDDDIEDQVDFAYLVEEETPGTWMELEHSTYSEKLKSEEERYE